MTARTAREMGIELPEEFADWEEVPLMVGEVVPHSIVVTVTEHCGRGIGTLARNLNARMFVPPKPKPTLPDVEPGAVVQYVDNQGLRCRAVRLDPTRDDGWKVFTQYDTFLGAVSHSDEDMLSDVNADGFTVELDGL